MSKQDGDSRPLEDIPDVDGIIIVSGKQQATLKKQVRWLLNQFLPFVFLFLQWVHDSHTCACSLIHSINSALVPTMCQALWFALGVQRGESTVAGPRGGWWWAGWLTHHGSAVVEGAVMELLSCMIIEERGSKRILWEKHYLSGPLRVKEEFAMQRREGEWCSRQQQQHKGTAAWLEGVWENWMVHWHNIPVLP